MTIYFRPIQREKGEREERQGLLGEPEPQCACAAAGPGGVVDDGGGGAAQEGAGGEGEDDRAAQGRRRVQRQGIRRRRCHPEPCRQHGESRIHRVLQSDTSGCSLGLADIKTKLEYLCLILKRNATSALMSAEPGEQPDVSPCIFIG